MPTKKQLAQRKRFRAAAKKCRGSKDYKACMRRELKK